MSIPDLHFIHLMNSIRSVIFSLTLETYSIIAMMLMKISEFIFLDPLDLRIIEFGLSLMTTKFLQSHLMG